MKVHELAEVTGITIGSMAEILRKITPKWMPRLLTIDQNANEFMIQRVVWTFLTVN